MIYCDTSYLVRLYWDEPGAGEVRDLCGCNEIASSIHAQAEIPAALHRSWREGRIDSGAFSLVVAQFQSELAASAFHWLSLGDSLFERMAACYVAMPLTAFLRAADALHLACAAVHGFTEVYSNDRHFLAAAPLFGLRGINVLSA